MNPIGRGDQEFIGLAAWQENEDLMPRVQENVVVNTEPERELKKQEIVEKLVTIFLSVRALDEKRIALQSTIEKTPDEMKFLQVDRDAIEVLKGEFEALTVELTALKTSLKKKVDHCVEINKTSRVKKISDEALSSLALLNLGVSQEDVRRQEGIYEAKWKNREEFLLAARNKWVQLEKSYNEARYPLNWLVYCGGRVERREGLPFSLQYNVGFPAHFKRVDFTL